MNVNEGASQITLAEMDTRAERRIDDMRAAQIAGQHFWIIGLSFRVADPTAFPGLMLDTENLCGYTDVHCALCGTTDPTDEKCPDL